MAKKAKYTKKDKAKFSNSDAIAYLKHKIGKPMRYEGKRLNAIYEIGDIIVKVSRPI